jgi:hypothetical protein
VRRPGRGRCADLAFCELKAAALCGDTFMGIGTTCTPNPCEAILGACCSDLGLCQLTLQADCGDIYKGNRTVCDPNPCTAITGVDPIGSASRTMFLGAPSPIPTRGKIEVAWSLPRAGFASLTVWDAAGRQCATLFQGELNAGSGRSSFTLGDGTGRVLPSGVYWLKLVSGKDHAVRKVVIAN